MSICWIHLSNIPSKFTFLLKPRPHYSDPSNRSHANPNILVNASIIFDDRLSKLTTPAPAPTPTHVHTHSTHKHTQNACHGKEIPLFRIHFIGRTGMQVQLETIGKDRMDSGSWFWKYKINGAHIQLELVELWGTNHNSRLPQTWILVHRWHVMDLCLS